MLADPSTSVSDVIPDDRPAPKKVFRELDELDLEDQEAIADEDGFAAEDGYAESLDEDEEAPGPAFEDEGYDADALESLGSELDGEDEGVGEDDALRELQEVSNVATWVVGEAAASRDPLPNTGLTLAETLEEAEDTLADRIKNAVTSRAWPVAVGMMVTAGVRDENRLTNVIFHINHPELLGRSIRPGETNLSGEWIRIRDVTVRPLLRRLASGGLTGVGGTEYVPDVGAPEFGRSGSRPEELGRKDLDAALTNSATLRDRVVDVAAILNLDPGLLAASLFAEVSSTGTWTRTTGTVASEELGLDDWFDPTMAKYLRAVIREHPTIGLAYEDISATGELWSTSSEKPGGADKPRGLVDAAKAVAAVGVYMAGGEAMLKRVLSNLAAKTGKSLPALESLQPEQRLTILRVTFNAGVAHGRDLFLKIVAGGDIPRSGKTTRDKHNAPRTAALHMARGVHLSQAIFGRPASDYQPAP